MILLFTDSLFECFVCLDVIGQAVNIGPLEDLMVKGKSSTKLELTIRDITQVLFSFYFYIDLFYALILVCIFQYLGIRV